MGVTLSVQTAVIVVSSIGAVYTAVAVLFGGLTCFFVRETRKRKGKIKPEDRERYAVGNTLSGDNVRCDSAYGTAASGSAPSPSASMDTDASQGHLTKKTKDFHDIELQNFSCETTTSCNGENSDSPLPVDSVPNLLPSPRAAQYVHKSENDLTKKQDVEATFQGGKPVKRTNSYLPSVFTEESSEPFTVLTVHKSTLKRKPKAARTNSQQPLMAGDDREGASDEEEKMEKQLNPAALRVIGMESGTPKRPKVSPSPRRKHGHQRPTPKKPARSNSTKPLMAYQDEDDVEELTQEDWEAMIQGTNSPSHRQSPEEMDMPSIRKSPHEMSSSSHEQTLHEMDSILRRQSLQEMDLPPHRQSLVLENKDVDIEKIEESINTLQMDLLQMISSL